MPSENNSQLRETGWLARVQKSDWTLSPRWSRLVEFIDYISLRLTGAHWQNGRPSGLKSSLFPSSRSFYKCISTSWCCHAFPIFSIKAIVWSQVVLVPLSRNDIEKTSSKPSRDWPLLSKHTAKAIMVDRNKCANFHFYQLVLLSMR